MKFAIFIIFILGSGACAMCYARYAFWFERWLENLYRNRQEEWVKLGRPLGRFWRPEDSAWSYLRSYHARNKLLTSFPKVARLEPSLEYHKATWWWRMHVFCGWIPLAILVLVIARLILNL